MSNTMIIKVSLDVDLMGFHGYYRCLKWDPQRTAGCISGIFDGIVVGISWDDGIEPTIRDSIFTNHLALAGYARMALPGSFHHKMALFKISKVFTGLFHGNSWESIEI